MTAADGPSTPQQLLIGLEVSAVCFVRDYVELHFDGPVLRALSDPFGVYDRREWRFPEGQSPVVMRRYIGEVVDDCELVPDRHLSVHFGEHRFVIPLDEDSRPGPEAAHFVGDDKRGQTDRRYFWIW